MFTKLQTVKRNKTVDVWHYQIGKRCEKKNDEKFWLMCDRENRHPNIFCDTDTCFGPHQAEHITNMLS